MYESYMTMGYSHKITVNFATHNPLRYAKRVEIQVPQKFVQAHYTNRKICVTLTIIAHASFSLPVCCIVIAAVFPF